MKHPVRRRLAAQESLERIVVRIAEHDLDAAYRFVDAVEASLALLSEMPEAGPRYETDHGVLAGRLRKWVVPRYRRYLLFYIFEEDVVHLIDVVDGRSDYDVEDSA
ncbi:MAG: type II toxin-antitoxin system RelE/ParE family toxin [Myxococcota bacterium]|nr:type II toxin-antitoxin system RelE/ParE family toxin [Myxococcota bacterium]